MTLRAFVQFVTTAALLSSLIPACATSTRAPAPTPSVPAATDSPHPRDYTETACGSRRMPIGGTVVGELLSGTTTPLDDFTISLASSGTVHSDSAERQIYAAVQGVPTFLITVVQYSDVTYQYHAGAIASSHSVDDEVTLVFRAPGCEDLRVVTAAPITERIFRLACAKRG
jgi:hypothetical protein